GRGGRAGAAPAARPLPADRARPPAVQRSPRSSSGDVAAAARARRRARPRRHGRRIHGGPAHRERPLASAMGRAAQRERRSRSRPGSPPDPGARRDRMRAPVIETIALTCRYPEADRPALDAVSVRVAPGTVTVVMGATGAGKSTLVRCLSRLVPCFTPAELGGDVRLNGASILDRTVGDIAGTIGMVFQDFEAQLFSTDVTQEVVFGLEHTGVPPAEMPMRVAAALAAVGL